MLHRAVIVCASVAIWLNFATASAQSSYFVENFSSNTAGWTLEGVVVDVDGSTLVDGD